MSFKSNIDITKKVQSLVSFITSIVLNDLFGCTTILIGLLNEVSKVRRVLA